MQHIRKFLKNIVISESKSPFGSLFVYVRKKNNSLRMCVDITGISTAKRLKTNFGNPELKKPFTFCMVELNFQKWILPQDTTRAEL